MLSVRSPRGRLVDVYDGRQWPVVACGNVYVSANDTPSHVTASVLTVVSSGKKTKSSKCTVAVGNSRGHVHAFLPEGSRVLEVLDSLLRDEKCLILIKRSKRADKMLKAHSWANLSVSDSSLHRQLDGALPVDSHKHKHRWRRKNDSGADRSVPRSRTQEVTSNSWGYHLTQKDVSAPGWDHGFKGSSNSIAAMEDAEINNNRLAKKAPFRYHSCLDVSMLPTVAESAGVDNHAAPVNHTGPRKPEKPGSDAKMKETSRAQSMGDLCTGLTLSVVGQRKADSELSLASAPTGGADGDEGPLTNRSSQPPTSARDVISSRRPAGDGSSSSSVRGNYNGVSRERPQSGVNAAPMATNGSFSSQTNSTSSGGGSVSHRHQSQDRRNGQGRQPSPPGSESGRWSGGSQQSDATSTTSARSRRSLPRVPVSEASERIKRFTEIMQARMTGQTSSASASSVPSSSGGGGGPGEVRTPGGSAVSSAASQSSVPPSGPLQNSSEGSHPNDVRASRGQAAQAQGAPPQGGWGNSRHSSSGNYRVDVHRSVTQDSAEQTHRTDNHGTAPPRPREPAYRRAPHDSSVQQHQEHCEGRPSNHTGAFQNSSSRAYREDSQPNGSHMPQTYPRKSAGEHGRERWGPVQPCDQHVDGRGRMASRSSGGSDVPLVPGDSSVDSNQSALTPLSSVVDSGYNTGGEGDSRPKLQHQPHAVYGLAAGPPPYRNHAPSHSQGQQQGHYNSHAHVSSQYSHKGHSHYQNALTSASNQRSHNDSDPVMLRGFKGQGHSGDQWSETDRGHGQGQSSHHAFRQGPNAGREYPPTQQQASRRNEDERSNFQPSNAAPEGSRSGQVVRRSFDSVQGHHGGSRPQETAHYPGAQPVQAGARPQHQVSRSQYPQGSRSQHPVSGVHGQGNGSENRSRQPAVDPRLANDHGQFTSSTQGSNHSQQKPLQGAEPPPKPTRFEAATSQQKSDIVVPRGGGANPPKILAENLSNTSTRPTPVKALGSVPAGLRDDHLRPGEVSIRQGSLWGQGGVDNPQAGDRRSWNSASKIPRPQELSAAHPLSRSVEALPLGGMTLVGRGHPPVEPRSSQGGHGEKGGQGSYTLPRGQKFSGGSHQVPRVSSPERGSAPSCHSPHPSIPPTPRGQTPFPSLFELCQVLELVPVQVSLTSDLSLADVLDLRDSPLEVPTQGRASEVPGGSLGSFQGHCAMLGGPGSAFRPVKTSAQPVHTFSLPAVFPRSLKKDAATIQPALCPGDFLIELNGRVTATCSEYLQSCLPGLQGEVTLTVGRKQSELSSKDDSSSKTPRNSLRKTDLQAAKDGATNETLQRHLGQLQQEVCDLRVQLSQRDAKIQQLMEMLPWKRTVSPLVDEVMGDLEMADFIISEDEFIV